MRATYEAEVVRMGDAIESRDLRDTFAICNISILSDMSVLAFLRLGLLLNCLPSPMLCVAAGATTFCGSTSESILCVVTMLNAEYCRSRPKTVLRCQAKTEALGKNRRCMDLCMAVCKISSPGSLCRLGPVHTLGRLPYHCTRCFLMVTRY